MRKFYFVLFALFLFIVGVNNKINAQFPQFEITPCEDSLDVVNLVKDVFLEGVASYQIKNITFKGDPTSVGHFVNGYFLGFDRKEGIVMSSGFASTLDNPNNCAVQQNASGNTQGGSDNDLAQASGFTIHDACVIEFDFKPGGDTVKFSYSFGSEEYHEYVDQFNDAFGFFLSGPGISGPYSNNSSNIAIVPGTSNTPVTINNVNCGNVPYGCNPTLPGGDHCEYLIDNTTTTNNGYSKTPIDAYTVPFYALNEVQACQWYHIKLAIGDAVDEVWDSGVFLEKGSFDPGNCKEETIFTHPTVDSLLYESCGNYEAILYFSLGSLRNDPYFFPFNVEGTATRDVDYQLITTYPGDTIYIPAGKLYDSLRIRTYYDGVTEPPEDVVITFNSLLCGGNLGVKDSAVVWIADLPEMPDTNLTFTSYCEQAATLDFANNIGGVPPYSFDWYTLNKTTPTVDYNPSGNDYFYFPCIIKDTCGQQVSDTAILIVPDLVANAGPDQSMCNNDSVQIQGSSPGAQFFHWDPTPPDPSLNGKEDQDSAWVYPSQNTDYLLTVSDNCTHSDQDVTQVLMDEAVADAGVDQVMCRNDSVTLEANGTDGYSWKWVANPPYPWLPGQDTLQKITISPSSTTTYTVTVTNDCGFSANDAVDVTVNQLPNADAGPPEDHVCFGQEYQLNASGGTSYLWTSNPSYPWTSGQDTLPDPVVYLPTQEPYTFSVQVWDAKGCANSDTIVIQVDPVPDLNLSTDKTLICYGGSATIQVTGDAEYTWSAVPPDPTLSGQESNPTIVVSPLVTTVYTLTGVAPGFSCPATLTQTITVKPELMSTFDMQADQTCQAETFTVLYSGNAGSSANYSWDFGGAQVITGSGGGPYDISWDTEGVKTITLSVEEDGCYSDSTSQNVTVLRTPVSSFDANVLEGCVPFTVDFNNTSTNLGSDVSYSWDFGTSDQSANPSPSYTYTQTGVFTVRLVVTNDGQCSNTSTQVDYIKANETPVADFEPVPPETVLEQPTIDFTDNSSSSESLTYLWDFGDGGTSTEKNPSHAYGAVGTYLVLLQVVSPNNCEDTISKNVIVHPDISVHAPKAFSPNGDGLNDFFDVYGTGLKEYLLQVYSRWGELMFESKNLEDKWDGKFNGELVPAGTYVYRINYKSMLDKDYTKRGTVTVMR